jgi:hypothetical protein
VIRKPYIQNRHKKVQDVTKMDQDEESQVRVVFQGDLRKRFEAVKRYYSLENNAELVRLLVTLRYEELKKEGKI